MKWRKLILSKAYNYQPPELLSHHWVNFTVVYRNKKIACRHLPQNNKENQQGIILVHPYHVKAKDYFIESGHAQLHHALGYEVFIFDFNTFGESQERLDYDFYLDLLEIARFIKNEMSIKKLHVHGISFGAAVVVRALVEKDHPFDKVIIENAMDDLLNYYKKRNKWIFLALVSGTRLYPRMTKDFKIYKLLKHCHLTTKALLLYSREDDLTTVKMGERLHQANTEATRLVILPGKHMESIKADPTHYRQTIIQHLNPL